MSAISILQEKLIGNFYTRFSVGDTWEFCFDEFWLLSHNVVFEEEKTLSKLILLNYPTSKMAIDFENISKSLAVSSNARQRVKAVNFGSNMELIITFENESTLMFPVDTSYVDWQWAINANGNDPYSSFIVGCFESGKVQVGNC